MEIINLKLGFTVTLFRADHRSQLVNHIRNYVIVVTPISIRKTAYTKISNFTTQLGRKIDVRIISSFSLTFLPDVTATVSSI